MKIFRYFILFIFITLPVLAQIPIDQANYSIWLNPPRKNFNFLLQVNLRYDLFVFEKNNEGKFETKFSVQMELYDSAWNNYKREYIVASVVCDKYEQTISHTNYYSGQFSLNLPPAGFNLRLTLSDDNNSKEIEIGTEKFSTADNRFQFPVIISQNDLALLEIDSVNISFTNYLKFSSDKFLMLLPADRNIDKAGILFKDSVIDLKQRMSKGLDYNLVSLDSLPLIDNSYILRLNDKTEKIDLPFRVIWFNKPRTLKNMELALRLMAYLFDKKTIQEIEKQKTDNQYYKFFEAWKKLDKTTKTAFNELMDEFYKRADESVDKFKAASQPNGALTDRGKIFILYGNPDSVERKFTLDGKATETWKYTSSFKHRFIFIDENKDGNLILKNK